MKILGIIPARYASTRFPGKPLININGKSMIQRVYEQVVLSQSLNDVIVATDDKRIEEHVKSFGGNVFMTSNLHISGTERCNEVVEKIGNQNIDIVINIQGDEPFINPNQIDALSDCFENEKNQIATLKKKIINSSELYDNNVVKVISDNNDKAIYFSRLPIPFLRGIEKESWLICNIHFKHIGIYAYRKEVLNEIVKLPMGNLEKFESLEQLRWIENGYSITVKETDIESISIDTPEDLEKIVF
jgi:3-deoxy-manno-octulosonate cytidylyltransferase (CMP-KDO synthetase)